MAPVATSALMFFTSILLLAACRGSVRRRRCKRRQATGKDLAKPAPCRLERPSAGLYSGLMAHASRQAAASSSSRTRSRSPSRSPRRCGGRASSPSSPAPPPGRSSWRATPRPDLVMLDLTLPDGDGRDVCRELRRRSDVPIVMLTARGTEMDQIVGLELGADDYVVKPFSAAEVISRIRAVLRRSAPRENGRPERSRSRSATRARPGGPRSPASRGERARALAQGVRPARRADAQRRPGGHARGPDVARSGTSTGSARPRRSTSTSAGCGASSATTPPTRLHRDGARRRLPLRRAGGRGAVSLRATLLLALAYVLLLALIAFGVPLALSLRDRVDSEVRGQARSQADVVAASASELLEPAAGRRRCSGPRRASRPKACAAG